MCELIVNILTVPNELVSEVDGVMIDSEHIINIHIVDRSSSLHDPEAWTLFIHHHVLLLFSVKQEHWDGGHVGIISVDLEETFIDGEDSQSRVSRLGEQVGVVLHHDIFDDEDVLHKGG